MANYNGQYNDLINTSFNSLFGRDAAPAGLDYWGGALSNPDSGITQANLNQSLVAGASGNDLAYYNNTQAQTAPNAPTNSTAPAPATPTTALAPVTPGTQQNTPAPTSPPATTASPAGYYTDQMARDYTTLQFNELFGRDPQPEGLDYWSNYLTSQTGPLSKEDFNATLLAGASPGANETTGTPGSTTPSSPSTGYDGRYNSDINAYFNSLFGRDAAPAGLDYWGGALSDPSSGLTMDNLQEALIAGASPDDLAYYNSLNGNPGQGQGLLGSVGTITPENIENPFQNNNYASNSPTTWSGLLAEATPPDISLSTVEPYQPQRDINTGYTSSSYQAPAEWRPNENELVQGRMEGLLNSGSQYMQNARATGLRTAQSRGLLNSSLAAGQSQKSAIEAALPIAQQDSQSMVNAGMTGYEGRIQGALANQQGSIQGELARQGHDQGLETIWAQEGASSRLSSQEEAAALRQSQFNAMLESGLSAQEADQVLNQTKYQTGAESDLSYQNHLQGSGLSYQNYLQGLEQARVEGQISSELSNQAHNQAMEIDWQKQEGYNYRTGVEAQLQSQIAAAELASNEKQAFASIMQTFGEKFQNDLSGINADTNMTRVTKTNAIKSAQDAYLSNLQYLSGVYGVDLQWQSIDIRSGEQVALDDRNAAEAAAAAEANASQPSDPPLWP